LRTQNKSNSKVDLFLERKIDYKAHIDPSTGSVDAHAVVTLHNTAPSTGLPDAIIGSNDQGLPPGMNKLFFSFYTPHRLKEAKIDGQVAGLEYQRELGYSVYSRFIEIPAGGTVVVDLELSGRLASNGTYRLVVSPQPMVNPDHVIATITTSVDYRFAPMLASGPGLAVQEGNVEAVLASEASKTIDASVRLVPR
jgi:hypothetical protein